jgi:hypothetical protein
VIEREAGATGKIRPPPPPPDDVINSKGGGSPVRDGTVEGRRGRERGRGGEEEKRGTWIWMDALPAGARGGRPPDLRGEGGGRRIGGSGEIKSRGEGTEGQGAGEEDLLGTARRK